jgi:flagellar biosynthesis protein FlhG
MSRQRPSYQQPVLSIAVSGVKGGVGTSAIAANLAVAMAMRGEAALLFDASFAHGGVARILGLKPTARIDDVLDGELTLDQLILAGPAGLSVIASKFGDIGLSRLSHLEHARLIALFSHLRMSADTLIVDTPSGFTDANLAYTSSAREILLVITEDPSAVDGAASAVHELQCSYDVSRFRVVVNRARSAHHGREVFAQLDRAVAGDVDVLLDHAGSIPEDPRIAEAAAAGMAVVEQHPRSSGAMALTKLAERMARWPRPVSPSGHIEFFVERLVQAADPHLVRATA